MSSQKLVKMKIKTLEQKSTKKGIKFIKQSDILDKIEMNGTGNSFVILKTTKRTS